MEFEIIKVILGEEVRSQNKACKWRWRIEGRGWRGLHVTRC